MTETSRPLLDDSDIFLANLGRLNKAMGRRLAPRLAAYGLDLSGFLLLKAIERGQVHPTQLAAECRMPPSLVSRHVDRLAELGFIERRLDPEDQRRIRLELLAAGGTVIADAGEAVRTMIRPLLGGLPADHRALFLDTLALLASRMSQE